jgi:hypothetical protein
MISFNLGTTNQTPNLADHRTLVDAELDAVTGGTRAQSVINTGAVARPEPLYPPIAK